MLPTCIRLPQLEPTPAHEGFSVETALDDRTESSRLLPGGVRRRRRRSEEEEEEEEEEE